MKPIPFKQLEIPSLDEHLRLHKYQFELKNQFPTIRIYDYTKEQITTMIELVYGNDTDPLVRDLIQSIYSTYDPSLHVYGELYFDVRLLVENKDTDELSLVSYDRFPWTFPIGILLDRSMFAELFRPMKFPKDIEQEEGVHTVRILEGESINRIIPEWDAYTGVLNSISIMERYFTEIDMAYNPREKLETHIYGRFSDIKGVPAHRINKKAIYDVRMINLTKDRYDKANKLSLDEQLELVERVEEWKEVKTWKDLPERSSSKFISEGQNFYGVDCHVSGDARARITIADKQVSLKYWNKEVIAALYVDAALRTHSSFIKDWEKKLNFPNLKQVVQCPCPICQKGKKFPRRSSQYPDNLVYTKEYKEQFNPEDL